MITLRMFTAADFPYFDGTVDPAYDTWNFFGFYSQADRLRRFAENGLVGPDHGQLAVDLDGVVVGDVSWHPVRYGPPVIPPSFNIGIQLRPEHRGHGHGTDAQRALGDYLFAVTAVHRIEAGTDTSNLAEQRSLVKAGFTRDGVLRGAQFRAGQFRDLMVFSRLRDDVPGVPG